MWLGYLHLWDWSVCYTPLILVYVYMDKRLHIPSCKRNEYHHRASRLWSQTNEECQNNKVCSCSTAVTTKDRFLISQSRKQIMDATRCATAHHTKEERTVGHQ